MKKCCAYCRLAVIERAERRAGGFFDIAWRCIWEGSHYSSSASRKNTSLFLTSCKAFDPIPDEEIVAATLAGRFG
jgi:hypothetical protein